MRWACVAGFLAAAVAVAGAEDKPKPDPKALEPFQGAWSVVSIERDGESVPDDNLAEMVLVVKGDERLIKAGDEVVSKATFTVDPAQKPPTIDIKVAQGPLAGKTVKGIYELKDGTLKICAALEGDKRPDDFTAKEGSGRLLQVFKKKSEKGKGDK